ncbi:MAG: hypothetical protein JST86_08165 [Bacteroidetes bacterium]|nr:hypothetical protein [Bacteroidota bacterium]
MEVRNDIWNELNELSPVLADINRANLFTVPVGYFESLEATIMMSIHEENGTLISSKEPVMDVPQGYFESLAGQILNKIKAQETAQSELKALSPLVAGIPNKNVFVVPQGYFENLAENVLRISAASDDVAEETQGISSAVAAISKINVFTAPQGYFETLPQNILQQAVPRQAKVVSMRTRSVATILKYAVAAMFTGVVALGVYKYSGQSNSSSGKIANVPGYVNEGLKIHDVDSALSKISDDDVIKYLQANGTDVESALVANSIDENDLPAQEDYLNDEKTLDKYLDNLDINDLKN